MLVEYGEVLIVLLNQFVVLLLELLLFLKRQHHWPPVTQQLLVQFPATVEQFLGPRAILVLLLLVMQLPLAEAM